MKLDEHKNTKKQGDVGLGAAIAYFSRIGNTVNLPLTDSQDYDLIIDDGKLKRVQIKTCTYKRNKYFTVSLSVKGGNRSATGKIKNFDKSSVELIFIKTSDKEYVIPTNMLKIKSVITLDKRYDKYIV